MNKKLLKFTEQLDIMREALDEMIGECEEKQVSIEDRAADYGRDMTEREQEKYDALEEKIQGMRDAMENIEYAFDHLCEIVEE